MLQVQYPTGTVPHYPGTSTVPGTVVQYQVPGTSTVPGLLRPGFVRTLSWVKINHKKPMKNAHAVVLRFEVEGRR